MVRTGDLRCAWLGIAGVIVSCATAMACGGRTTVSSSPIDAGGTVGIDSARDPVLDGGFDAGSSGARAVAQFEAALRAHCMCSDASNLGCYDWAARFQGQKRDCYVAFLDRHSAEGLAACVFENAKGIGDCLRSCGVPCNTAALLDDSPMHDILFDLCHAPPSYFEETRDCSGP